MNNWIRYYSSYFLILLWIILFTNCFRDKSPLALEEIDPNYPTTLYPLTTEELQLLQEEFDVLNDYKILSKLNQYGFTGGGPDWSKSHPNPQIKLTENEALQIAISTLVKNKKFTNVTDSLDLLSCPVRIFPDPFSNDSTHYTVAFFLQKYNGYEVLFTRIGVSLYGDGAYTLSGFWYSDIYIPPKDNVNPNLAKMLIIGQKITYYSVYLRELIVTEDIIGDYIEKVIVPKVNDENIELRVCWQMPILFFSDAIGWYIYVDTTTGEIVRILPRLMID